MTHNNNQSDIFFNSEPLLSEPLKMKILTILNNITKNEDNTPLIDYPVLIGSRAVKWHISSFREPNDWDMVATPLQTTLFINKVKESGATFKNIKLIHYPGGGLKLVGEYIVQLTDKKFISFDIELVSETVDLRNMKANMNLNKKESDKDESDEDDNISENNSVISNYSVNFEDSENSKDNLKDDDMENYDKINKIEFERFNDVHPKMSALMILELCCNIEDKMMFPLLSNFLCIVAPLKILEALKTSHIYWPDDFHKNISDLHLLRILLDYNKISTIQPLCSPQRDESIELMLKTRIKETEIIRGIPGAHINLNMSNDDFLENKDDLFVQKRVPHDDLHERVKYGDHPIYQGLKDDQSKAWIKKSLFEKLDYQTKINCIKEEVMAIALERYLIPMISKDQENSYKLALARICTTLAKGWFRKFAIDNYPRLSNLDKDLLGSDDYTVVERTGIKIISPVNSDVSVIAIITTMHMFNNEDCSPYARWTASVVILPTYDLEVLSDNDEDKDRHENEDEDSSDDDDVDRRDDKDGDRDSFDMDDVDISFKDPLKIHPYYASHRRIKFSKLTSKHTFVLGIAASNGGGSWSGEDIWESIHIKVKSVDYVASLLEIPELTGDLLFKYVLDCLKPTSIGNGDTPLKHWINKLKVEGAIPIEPKQHPWYYAWNYKLNRKSK
ncbi:hypothetical protein C1646_767949 [Rhizophagus diaphanus]|nr:hypothetical protein C1646_767949 [Rhizophagus diaphanus] [Rhizophagus sp. MUCL 43196]